MVRLEFVSVTPSPPTPHFQNYVYAVGGNDGVASLSSVERFNPHLNKWTEVSEMGQRRAGNGVSKLNGCLYVVGGFGSAGIIKSFFLYIYISGSLNFPPAQAASTTTHH